MSTALMQMMTLLLRKAKKENEVKTFTCRSLCFNHSLLFQLLLLHLFIWCDHIFDMHHAPRCIILFLLQIPDPDHLEFALGR